MTRMAVGAVAKKLRCRFGFHRWVRHRNDEGKPYRLCADCGRFREPPPDIVIPLG
jgi:hypothetical protein